MASTINDEDDNISVTSTAPSEQREEYLVDRIVGERDNDGTNEYLVMWEDYPDCRCTWEPETNFDGGIIIPNWEHTKMRVNRGLEEAFDFTALERKIREWEEATAFRKLRRREKRKRLGLSVAESEEDEGENGPPQDDDEQELLLNEETSDALDSRRGGKRRISHTLESSSDKEGARYPTSRSESPANRSTSSDDDRPHVGLKVLAESSKKLSYQGTQRPAKTTHGVPMPAQSVDEKLLATVRHMNPELVPPKEQKAASWNAAQAGKLIKAVQGLVKDRHDSVARRPSFDAPQRQLPNPQPPKAQSLDTKGSSPLGGPNAPKKRGRPLGWRKYPVSTDSLDKDAQQPRVGVKTAPSTVKRKVTGSVISKNWNKPVAKKRLSLVTASSAPTNPNSFGAKNQNRFMNLATQHRFAKAGRNEPPPRMEDLILFNAKDGPPKPGEQRMTPFQMIQAQRTVEASGAVTSAGAEPKVRRVSFANTAESPTSAKAVPPKVQESSIFSLSFETRESALSGEPKDTMDSPTTLSRGNRKTVMFTEPEEMDTIMVDVGTEPNEALPITEPTPGSSSPNKLLPLARSSIVNMQEHASMGERREKHDALFSGDAMDVSSDYTLPENPAADASSKPVVDAQKLINSWGFQNPPSNRPDPLTRAVTIDNRLHRSRQANGSLDSKSNDSSKRANSVPSGEREGKATEPSSSSNIHAEEMHAGDIDSMTMSLERSSRGANGVSEPDEAPKLLPWSLVQGNFGQTLHGCTVFGALFRGETFVTRIAFVGLAFIVRTLFLSIKIPPKEVNVHLRHSCTPEDYKKFFHTDIPFYFGAGHLNVLPHFRDRIHDLTGDLVLHGCGALFFAPKYSLLIYPTGTEEWSFLDRQFLKDANFPVSLRFVMFRPIPEFLNPKANECTFKGEPLNLGLDESTISRLFREVFHIEYKALVESEKKTSNGHEAAFFIMYSPSKKDEHDLLASFLEANNATVYSSYTPGAWDYVLKEIHTQLPALHTIPSLYRAALTHRSLFHPMFHVTLDLSLAPPELETPQHLTRLFPSGGTILFTDSFLLTQPDQAVRILNWLVLHVFPNKPSGSWKLALRPRFRDWLLNLVQSRNPPKGSAFMELYAALCKLLPLSLMDEDTDFEIPKPEAYVVTPRYLSSFDHSVGLGDLANETEILRRNDERLVDWYAGWARTKVYSMRRLHAVYSHQVWDKEQIKKPWRRKWNHVAFWTAEECLREHNIERWERETKASDLRVMEKLENVKRKIAEWERGRKEKRDAAVKEVQP